jgi:methionyl-tRNA formyltransferase
VTISMRISLLCSDKQHPVNDYLLSWVEKQQRDHQIELVRYKKELSGGDLLFLISCTELINSQERAMYNATLVLHASDLPYGRGWSPHIWQIIEGKEQITLSLLEAEDKVDSGRIWKKVKLFIPSYALWEEINDLLFNAEIELIDYAVQHYVDIVPIAQDDSVEASYYPRRTPEDSLIDPNSSIRSQFNLLRICDPHRFPAYFYLKGKKYKLILEKIDD